MSFYKTNDPAVLEAYEKERADKALLQAEVDAFAARQPVGEPVAFRSRYIESDRVGIWVYHRERPMHESDVEVQSLYAAPPAQAVGESVEEDVYCAIADMIEPYVQREGINPNGELPASVHDSVSILLDHWLKTRQPAQAVDDRFPGGFSDAIAYVNQIEELAEGIHTQVFGYESDGEAGATTVLQMVRYQLAEKPAQAVDLGAVADVLRELLTERQHRTDGSLMELAERCRHLSRGDRDCIALRGTLITELEAQAVDLGEFREAIATGMGYCSGFLGDRAAGEKLRELLALIDSQDSSNG
ncbi:hypothetical protein ACTUVJ_000245 [Stenotrophomonas indicatrix]